MSEKFIDREYLLDSFKDYNTDIVEKKFDQINSNLDELAFGENAGGKNLFNPKCLLNATYNEKTNTINVSNNTNKALDMVFKENTQYTFSAYIKQSSSSTNNRLMVEYTDGTTDTTFLYTQSTSEVYLSATSKSGKTISEVKWYYSSSGTATFRNFQIEEGTVATEYEPYIPSVKMLADEVSAQNESLSDLENAINGLNDDNYWEQGTWNILGQKVDTPTIIRTKEKLILPIDYSVSLVNSNYVYEVDYYENGAYKNNTGWISGSIVIPNGQEFVLLIRKVDNSDLVPTERNAISVLPKSIGTINDKLKNDLAPKKIELQNVDERVTIQDNGSFIINGFAFVNLLVTFNETLPQWSNFVRLPRPKGGDIPVHCENSVRFTIYSQDNLPGDCGTYDVVQSGTEIRLLVNYEVA